MPIASEPTEEQYRQVIHLLASIERPSRAYIAVRVGVKMEFVHLCAKGESKFQTAGDDSGIVESEMPRLHYDVRINASKCPTCGGWFKPRERCPKCRADAVRALREHRIPDLNRTYDPPGNVPIREVLSAETAKWLEFYGIILVGDWFAFPASRKFNWHKDDVAAINAKLLAFVHGEERTQMAEEKRQQRRAEKKG